MTLKELSQLYYLTREVERDRARLADLRAKATSPKIPGYSSLPRNSTAESQLEKYVAATSELEALIAEKMLRCIDERKRLEYYIASIQDSLTRQIFTLRFVDGLKWSQIALRVGGNNTAAGVKMACYRYIQRNQA